jgi:AcrR family transcriptional regulator
LSRTTKAGAAVPNADVQLRTKMRPSQDRSRATFEEILTATGELLADIGFERLTTNRVCERAGLTPPAVYRYFPNKYAILAELGRRLMSAQDIDVLEFIDAGGGGRDDLELEVSRWVDSMSRTVQITRDLPGGIWVMRALRALPNLHHVRLRSRDMVAERLRRQWRARGWKASDAELELASRLTIELMYSATEMVVEEPDLDGPKALEETARMVVLYHRALP